MSSTTLPTSPLRLALLFPGQGSQAVGMGGSWVAEAQSPGQLLHELNALLPRDADDNPLSTLMQTGPEASLMRTLYTQPAIVAVSVLALKALKTAMPTLTPVVTTGHSLGELPALYAAGVITEQALLTLVCERAKLMEQAPAGSMAAVLGFTAEQVQTTLNTLKQNAPAEAPLVVVANDNAPGQVVISGSAQGIEAASKALKAAGAKRVITLPVGGAFHSPLMEPAAKAFEAHLQATPFQNANFPVISNVNAQASQEGTVLQSKLAQQIPGSVRWTETMNRLVEDYAITVAIEVGPGKVLSGLLKKTHPNVTVLNVADESSLQTTLEALKALTAEPAIA